MEDERLFQAEFMLMEAIYHCADNDLAHKQELIDAVLGLDSYIEDVGLHEAYLDWCGVPYEWRNRTTM